MDREVKPRAVVGTKTSPRTKKMPPPPTRPQKTPEPKHTSNRSSNSTPKPKNEVSAPLSPTPTTVSHQEQAPIAEHEVSIDPTSTADTGFQHPEQPWTPQEPFTTFDWTELEQRYAERMQHIIDDEHRVWERLGRLNQLFEAWARAGQTQELARGRKRLCTRMAYVQQHERKLEQSLKHYLRARDAVQAALLKLDSPPDENENV